jgi:hypothetical protein
MPAVLRAYGSHFDVDAYLADCPLPVCAVKRRGEPVFPASRPDGRRHTESGVHVLASGAGFDDFSVQVEEAIAFLRTYDGELRRLRGFPGIETVTLDFGIERRDGWLQCDRLPSELLQLAGTLGFDIELSQYPPGQADDDGHNSPSGPSG